MSESNEKHEKFFGTYFDRDGVLRLSRWADVVAWIILTVYVLSWVLSFIVFMAQYFNGLLYDKGLTFLTVFNIFKPYLTEPLPGVLYFFALQTISKGLLILLDIEDNTRHSSRN